MTMTEPTKDEIEKAKKISLQVLGACIIPRMMGKKHFVEINSKLISKVLADQRAEYEERIEHLESKLSKAEKKLAVARNTLQYIYDNCELDYEEWCRNTAESALKQLGE